MPGLSLAVVANDQLVFARGYGVRDVENAAELIAAWAASLTADSSFLPG